MVTETALNDGSTLNVDGDMTTVDLTFDANADSLLFGGTDLTITGTFTAGDGTVTYDGADQNVTDLAYNNLILAGTGIKSAATGFTVGNDLTFATAVTLDVLTGTFTVGGAFAHGMGVVQYSQGTGTQVVASLSYYDLTIAGNSTKQLAGDIEVENNFTLVDNGNFDADGNMVTYNGDNQAILGVNYFDLTLESSTGVAPRSQKTSAVSLDVTNDFVMLANTELVLMGAISVGNDTTFDTDSAVNYAGNNQTIEVLTSGGTPVSYENLLISGAGTKYWNTDAGVNQVLRIQDSSELIVNGNFILANPTVVDLADSAVLTLNGTTVTVDNFTAGVDTTVKYAAIGDQTIIAANYGHLVLQGIGTRTLGGDIGIAQTFTIAGTTPFAHADFAVDYNGANTQTIASTDYYDIILSGTGDKIWNSGITMDPAGTLIFNSDITLEVPTLNLAAVNSLTTNNQGTVKYTGVDQGVTDLDYHNLTLAGRVGTLQGDLDMTGSLTINTDATLETSTFDIALQGDWTNNGTFNANTNLVTFDGTTVQTIGGTSTTVFNDFTLNNATGIAGSADVEIAGTVTDTDGSANMTAGTFTYSGASQTVIDGTYYSLDLTGTGTATPSGEITASSSLNVVTGLTLDIADNNLTVNGVAGGTTTIGGTLTATTATVDINSDLDFSGGTITFTDAGRLEFSGATLTVGTFNAGMSRFVYDGASQTIADLTYYDLELAGSGNRTVSLTNALHDFFLTTGTATLGAALDVDGSITMATGTTLDAAGFAINVFVDWDNSGTFVASGNTVTFDGDALQTITSLDYFNLNLSGTGDKAAVNVNVSGDLTFITNITLSVSGALNVIGTLTPAMGTVNYNGADQTVTDLTYYDLELSGTGTKTGTNVTTTHDLIFSSDVTLTISGALDIGNALVHNSQGTVHYLGGSGQDIFATEYYNLTISNGDKNLLDDTSVVNDFTYALGAGRMILGAFNLELAAGGMINGQSGIDAAYFVTNGLGTLDLGLSDVARDLTIGSMFDWSDLRIVNSSLLDTQTLSLQAKDGVNGLAGSDEAVDVTFSVTNRTEDFIMAVLDSSAMGTLFNRAIAGINHTTAGGINWTELGYQFTTDLTQDGDYYFANMTLSEVDLFVTTSEYLGGHGSLIFAIAYANQNVGLDTISFDPGLFNHVTPQTITIDPILASGFTITDSVIIKGAGSTALTIDGNNLDTIFTMDNGGSVYVNLSGMTIANGNANVGDGGGIYNDDFLEMSDVMIANSAAANGGGIYNGTNGNILMDRVYLHGNSATADGGGIYNFGNIQMTNVEVDNNFAVVNGGGIFTDAFDDPVDGKTPNSIYVQNVSIFSNIVTGDGGGIYLGTTRMYGSNVTIADNIAADGSAVFIADNGTGPRNQLYLEQSTIALNTALTAGNYAVANGTEENTIFRNSIITENQDGASANLNIQVNRYTNDNNYVNNENGTSVFSDPIPVDHGGWVDTLALNTGNFNVVNSIIDESSDDGETIYDARGYMRANERDLGAYEAGSTASGAYVDGAYVAINQDRNLYYQSIETAIYAAVAGETIVLVDSRHIVNTQITVNKDLIFLGGGSDVTVLDASDSSERVMLISNGTDVAINVRIDGIGFFGGQTTTNGGSIMVDGESLLLQNSSITGASAVGSGGGIYSAQGYVVLERSTIVGNSATMGGGIYNELGGLKINESTISGNNASSNGGGIYNEDDGTRVANLIIFNSTLNNNNAVSVNGMGGAIFAQGQVEMTNTTIAYNNADIAGAVYLDGTGLWKITNVTVAYNTSINSQATANNAALMDVGGDLFMINDIVAYNTLTSSGSFSDLYSHDPTNVYRSTYSYTAATANWEYQYDNTMPLFATSELNIDGSWSNAILKDNGGWSHTIALSLEGSTLTTVNKGVPSYDQRGYDVNYRRDRGAHEYDGIVAYYYDPTISVTSDPWIGTSTIEEAVNAINGTSGPTDLSVALVNTRILEANITVQLWKEITDALTARTVYLYGHQEGGTVISGGHQDTVFVVEGTSFIAKGATSLTHIMGTLELQRVTVTDGFTTGNGGAFITSEGKAAGKINITDSTLTGNIAMGRGGAIFSRDKEGDQQDATFTLDNVLVSDNVALGSGGGAHVGNILVANNSTFAENHSFSRGGGIAAVKVDGAGSATLNNSTVAFNIASGRGGGVANMGILVSGNNIIAKNRSGDFILGDDRWGNSLSGFDYVALLAGTTKPTLTNGGTNLVEYQNGQWVKDPSVPYFFGPLNDDGDIANGDLLGVKEFVFATDHLTDNGGWSETIALNQESAAYNTGSGSATDQRGYGVNRARDIGAFELNGIVASANGQDYSTIREAVAVAPSGSTVTLKATRITEHDALISADITVTTEGAGDSWYNIALVDARSFGRVYSIKSNTVTATLSNMMITNGLIMLGSGEGEQQAAGNGGAIFNAGNLTLNDVAIAQSYAQLSGGAIYSVKTLNVNATKAMVFAPETTRDAVYFERNMSKLRGGAIYASNTLALTGADYPNQLIFRNNYSNDGGAVYADRVKDGSSATMDYTYFVGNNATKRGGAVYFLGSGDAEFSHSDFEENSSMEIGGAIYVETAYDFTLANVDVVDNYTIGNLDTMEGKGGGAGLFFDGLSSSGSNLTIVCDGTTASNWNQNETLQGSGGAIYMKDANDLHIYSTSVALEVSFSRSDVGNWARFDGGSIYVTDSGDITLGQIGNTENVVEFNYGFSMRHGGGMYIQNSGDLTANGNIHFWGNYSDADNDDVGDGGAIYMIDSGDVNMTNNITFNVNGYDYRGSGATNTENGGAMYFERVGNLSFDSVELGMNSTSVNGGSLYIINSGNVSLNDWDSHNNFAWNGVGGGIYIENGTNDRTLTITNSSFDVDFANEGGAVYIDHSAQMLVTNATFGNSFGATVYVGYGNVAFNFTTFAGNTTGAVASSIYMPGMVGETSTFSINNSIVNDGSADNALVIGTTDMVTITSGANENNVFTYYYDYLGSQIANLVSGSYTDITSYRPFDDLYGVASGDTMTALDGFNNIVGTDIAVAAAINNNLFLASDMFYHPNRMTRAFALESNNSIAYRYELNGTETRAGQIDPSVQYDQRGNMRNGIQVVDTNGVITYVYYQFSDVDGWQKVTVAEDGATTYEAALAADVHVSIGAFEPNFYMTVTSNADHEQNDDRFNNVPEWTSIDNALANGVTLRESMFWIDTYNISSLTTNDLLFNADRYVKFADSMFAIPGTSNVITLGGARDIMLRSDVTIGMVNNYLGLSYTDANSVTHYFMADNTFRGQDDASRITVSGNDATRIFHLETRSDDISRWSFTATLSINNITLTNAVGLAELSTENMNSPNSVGRGGAIFIGNDATVYTTNAVIKDSEARNTGTPYWVSGSDMGQGGGIYVASGANLFMYDSTVTGNHAIGTGGSLPTDAGLGGGIYNEGITVIERSLIDSNYVTAVVDKDTSAGDRSGTGGGIWSGGTLTLLSSTVTGNYNESSEVGDGAAITIWNGTATIDGNTIAFNKAYEDSPLNLSRNSYAIYLRAGNVNLRNNLMAQNYIKNDIAQNRRDIIVSNSVNLTENHNIIGSFYQASGYYDFAANMVANNDILGNNSSGYVEDLNLSSDLLYNGGITRNYRVQSGSRAIAAGNYTAANLGNALTYDQRNVIVDPVTGQLRETIGAYELLTYVEVPSDIPDAALPAEGISYNFETDEGGWTTNLRNALYLSDQGGQVIVDIIDDSETFTIEHGQLEIFNGISVTTRNLVTPGNIILTIDGQNNSRIFAITDPATLVKFSVELENMNLINGNADNSTYNGYGGAIYSTEGLSLVNVDISDMTASGHGGAIYVLTGGLTLDDVNINNSTAAGHGGAIYLQTDSFAGVDVNITNATAAGHGGAIYLPDGDTFSLTSSTYNVISDNVAGGSGGGIFFGGNSISIDNTVIRGNTAGNDSEGGGVFVSAIGTVEINYSTIAENSALRGGGIFVYSGSLSMLNATVANNTALNDGGGLYIGGNGLSLTYVTVANNIAGYGNISTMVSYDGGGIYLEKGSLTMTNSIVAQNFHDTTTIETASASTPNSDIYLATTAVNGTIQYNVIGTINKAITSGTGNIILGTDAAWSELKVDTGLSDNLAGPNPMPMLYVFNGSVAINHANFIAGGVNDDQRGVARHTGVAEDNPTIGAYEKRYIYYYFNGTTEDASLLTNWTDELTPTSNPTSFDIIDGVFVIDTRAANDAVLSVTSVLTDWVFGDKTSLEVNVDGDLTIEQGVALTVATMSLSGGYMTVEGVVDAPLDIGGGTNPAGGGTLVLNASDTNLANLNLMVTNTDYTTKYTYAPESQTIKVVEYGNLELSGSNKVYNSAALTVHGYMTVASDSTFTGQIVGVGGDLSVNGAFNGAVVNIGGDLNVLDTTYTSTGATDVAGKASFDGSTIAVASLSAGSLDSDNSNVISGGEIAVAGDLMALNSTLSVASGDNITAGNIDAKNSSLTTTGTVSASGATGIILDNSTINATMIAVTNPSAAITAEGGTTSRITADTFTVPAFEVEGSGTVLEVDNNAADIFINDTGTGIGNVFDVTNITVGDPGTLDGKISFITTGDAVLDFTGNSADNIYGTLAVTADTITLTNVVLNNGALELGNTQPIQLGGYILVNGIVFNGPVILIADTQVVANRPVEFNGSVTGAGYDLEITSATSVTVSDITIDDLDVNSPIVVLQGDVLATGIVDMHSSPVTIDSDTSITAVGLNNIGAIAGNAGTENLLLNITNDATINGITNIADLTMQGDALYVITDDVTILGSLTNSSLLIDLGMNNLTGGGNFVNNTVLMTTGIVDFVGNLNNVGLLTAADAEFDGTVTNAGILAVVNLSSGGLLSNQGNIVSTGLIDIAGPVTNSLGATMDVQDISLTGNLNNAGTLDSLGTVTLDGVTQQAISNTGILNLNSMTLANAAGLRLVDSNVALDGDFEFAAGAGKVTINDYDFVVTGALTVNDMSSQWFITNASGSLYRMIGAMDTADFYVGSATDLVQFTLSRPFAAGLVGMNVFDNVTIDGTRDGATIFGIDETAGFTVVVDMADGISIIDGFNFGAGSRWADALEKSDFASAPTIYLADNSSGSWVIGAAGNPHVTAGTDFSGFSGGIVSIQPGQSQFSMAFSLAGTNFGLGDEAVLGLNDTQQKDREGGASPILYPGPDDGYKGFFTYEEGSLDSLTQSERFPGVINDPTRRPDLLAPPVFEFISLDGGVFQGMPNGEYSFPTMPELPVLPDVDGEEEWLDEFLDLAQLDVNELFGKHEICKSDLDRMLDALVG